jgi:hypothetical protein
MTFQARHVAEARREDVPLSDATATIRSTQTGRVVALAGLLLAASAFRAVRFEVGPLLFQPYLIGVGVLVLTVGFGRLRRLPPFLLPAMTAFLLIYAVSALQGSGFVAEVVKVGIFFATIAFVAVGVRTHADVVLAVLAVSVAIAVLSVHGLLRPSAPLEGINVLPGVANRNGFSIYALPMLLLAGTFILHSALAPRVRLALTVCVLLTVVAIFSTANRSGYLGVVFVAVVLAARHRRLRDVVVLVVIGVFVVWGLQGFGSTEAFDYRLEQTRVGYNSDRLRSEAFREAIRVGLAHPALGVGPQRLPDELAGKVGFRGDAIDSHNVVGHVVGGAGFLAFGALVVLLGLLCLPPRGRRLTMNAEGIGHGLLRSMIALWLLRGMFSREVLYSPAFSIALGLAVGMCILEGVWSRRAGHARVAITRVGIRS